MKTTLIFAAFIFLLSASVSAQVIQSCSTESFNGQANGWTYSQGAHIGNYDNPTNGCSPDRGIITPGVGGNNPCNIRTGQFESTGGYIVELSFDMIVLNANLKCNTWKDYACQTSVDVFYYVNGTKYTGTIDQPLPANGPGNSTNVSFAFYPGDNLPIGTLYSIEFCFKPKSGVGNCNQQNTKYVFDNFRNCETANSGQVQTGHVGTIHERGTNGGSQTIQNCKREEFSGQPSGWTYSQGAHVGKYDNPVSGCTNDRGIITPGVGGNNPCNIRTGNFVSTGATWIEATFDMIVLNANLRCDSWKDYPCQTSVDVFYYVNGTKFTGTIDQALPGNGPLNNSMVTLSFSPGDNLPAGTIYNVEFCFKPKSGVGDCIQQNTKYVFDNFQICETANRIPMEIHERKPNMSTMENMPMPPLSISPNPTKGSEKITANGDADTKSISLVDNTGKVLKSVAGTRFMIFDIKNLNSGKYYIQFEKNNGDQVRKLVMVNK